MLPEQRQRDHGRRARRASCRTSRCSSCRRRSQQAGLAAAVALAPDRSRRGERAGAARGARRACAPARSRRPPATTPRAASARGEAVGFVGDEVVAWGEPGETLRAVLAELADGGEDGAPELISVLAGEEAPLGAGRARARWSTAASSSSCATAASRRTGGCWPPSSARARPPRARLRPPARDHAWRRCRRAAPQRARACRATATRGGPLRVRRRVEAARRARSCSPRRCAGRARRACESRWSARRQAGRRAARRSACDTVGDLLEHLPRDSREARTVAALRRRRAGDRGGQVRSIAARPVRRRGMRPLVEASVFDATGTMRATFFNQPWLVERYPPGTRLLLHGKADGARAASASPTTRRPASRRRRRARRATAQARVGRPLPGRARASARRRSSRSCSEARGALARRRRAARRRRCASPSGCPTAPARWRRCTSRATRARREQRRAGGSRSRSCC